MDVNSLSKKLLFNTIRVDTVLEDGSEGSGTAFVVSHTHRRGSFTFIVTNRHLVEGVRSGGLVFTQKRNGQPLIGQRFQLNIEDFPHAWFLHPDPEVDLAIVPMRPLEQAARDRGLNSTTRPSTPDCAPTPPHCGHWMRWKKSSSSATPAACGTT
jgi:hypothetical protein